MYAPKFGLFVSNLVTGLLRSNVKRFTGGKEEFIWLRTLADLARRAALASADGEPVSQLIRKQIVETNSVSKN